MNQKQNKRFRLISILLVVMVAASAAVGVFVYARYVFENRRDAEIKASNFHISSNYLVENGDANAPYAAYAPQNGIHFTLHNFEKENVALISDVDIAYEIKVTKNNSATNILTYFKLEIDGVLSGSSTGILSGGAKKTLDFLLTPTEGADIQTEDIITVTVKTTSPYVKTLSAKFQIQDETEWSYTITPVESEKISSRYELTLTTNAYSGELTVVWPEALLPDNTNLHMSDWQNGTPGTMTVHAYTSYTLIFFNPDQGDFDETNFEIESAG